MCNYFTKTSANPVRYFENFQQYELECGDLTLGSEEKVFIFLSINELIPTLWDLPQSSMGYFSFLFLFICEKKRHAAPVVLEMDSCMYFSQENISMVSLFSVLCFLCLVIRVKEKKIYQISDIHSHHFVCLASYCTCYWMFHKKEYKNTERKSSYKTYVTLS